MKKSLLAVALLGAVAGAAHAQINVKVFGSIDGGVRHLSNVNAAGGGKTSIGSIGGLGADRLGFSGSEDLGNGLKATFHLESGFNIGTGALDNPANKLFNRTAKVGLAGAWGSLDVGHQFSVAFNTLGMYEPFKFTHFSYTGIIPGGRGAAGTSAGITATTPFGNFGGARFDNDIQYNGTFNNFTVRAEYSLGEIAGSNRDNRAAALGLAYAQGPFGLGAAYTAKKTNVNFAPAAPSYQDNTELTAGGVYRAGPFRFTVGVLNQKQETGTAVAATRSDTSWAGVTYYFTPTLHLTGAHYSTDYALRGADGRKKLSMLSLVKNVSKRTEMYLEFDRTRFSGVAIGNVSPAKQDLQTGFSIGMFHQF